MALLDNFRRPNAPEPSASAPGLHELLSTSRATPPTNPTTAEIAARTALRQAIAALPAVNATAAEAATRASRAQSLVDNARGDLARHDGLDAAIRAHQVAALSAQTDQALPPALISARRDRTEAREAVEKTLELVADLVREAGAATAAVTAAQAHVRACEAAVLKHVAETTARQMRDAEVLAAHLRASVFAYADSLSSSERPGALPSSAGMAPHDSWSAMFLEMVKNDGSADRARWTALRQRLSTDPDATLED